MIASKTVGIGPDTRVGDVAEAVRRSEDALKEADQAYNDQKLKQSKPPAPPFSRTVIVIAPQWPASWHCTPHSLRQ